MNSPISIKSALVSVFNKEGLEPIIRRLNELNITIYSTGGTQSFIEDLQIPVIPVEDLTAFPSILGGRVKTLHPKIFGGILNRRGLEADQEQVAEHGISNIDLVIVDLYPFEDTVASGASHEDIIEKIDIGGISLIRAAAKNYNDVLIVSHRDQYSEVLDLLNANEEGAISLEARKDFATKAFNTSSHYDTQIFNYMNGGSSFENLKLSTTQSTPLRYGENPHQRGIFYGDLDALFEKFNGKELSYNNLLDVDAAVNLMREFDGQEPTFAILKHNNACGIASRPSIEEAYLSALGADPVSAFGGVLISNTNIDLATATHINDLFCEVLIAPSYDAEALELLKSKKNRILLAIKNYELATIQYRTVLNGILGQDSNDQLIDEAQLQTLTKKQVTEAEKTDLIFANKIVKHTKSNTIVLVKDKMLLASGTGQTSRVDALRQAIHKAKSFDFELKGSVMASDAFFPFPDCVEIAHLEGIDAVIQPGGSIKDNLSITYCDENNMAMLMTGIRHFKH